MDVSPSRSRRDLQLYPTGDLIPDLSQFRRSFVGKVLQRPGAAVPIPAVVLVAFNLVQDGVGPGSHYVRFLLLHDLMGGIPLAGQVMVFYVC
jgi:hypothetical protein